MPEWILEASMAVVVLYFARCAATVVGCYDQRISSAHPARGSFVGE